MHAAADGGVSSPSAHRNYSHDSIVSELASLIAHVEAGMRLLDAAIASEASFGNQEAAGNVFILDDVTPRYLQANATLSACNAGLGVALRDLVDSGEPTSEPANPARSIAGRLA